MLNRSINCAAGIAVLSSLVSQASLAQTCAPGWNALGPGINGPVYALTEWDPDADGPSPKLLIAGGSFTGAGTANANNIAAWTGSAWVPLGSGTNGAIYALAVFDDDGSGPNPAKLYAGGSFSMAGGATTRNAAVWNGVQWVQLGSGLDGPVYSFLTVPAGVPGIGTRGIAIGGDSLLAGRPLAFSDGTNLTLSPFQSEVQAPVLAMEIVDRDRSGPEPAKLLFCSGHFSGGSSRLFQLESTGISSTGFSPSSEGIFALKLHDEDGPGPRYEALFVGTGGGPLYDNLFKSIGTTFDPQYPDVNRSIYTLAVFDFDGAGLERAVLVAGGFFTTAQTIGGIEMPTPVPHIAVWNGIGWSTLNEGTNQPVFALHSFDPDDAGPELPMLIAAGEFTSAGGMPAARIAAWSGCPSPPNQPCPGDINGNGVVGLDDIAEVLMNWDGNCD